MNFYSLLKFVPHELVNKIAICVFVNSTRIKIAIYLS